MVSLFDMWLQRPTWAHLSTGIPTVDQMLHLQSDGFFDFQSVPANAGVTAMVCNLMVTHLAESENHKVLVLETLNPFQWDLLRQHPRYDAKWDGQISICSLLSVAEIFWFFTLGPGVSMDCSSTLVFITNFHEIVELYSLHVAQAYEEALLKHQIDCNREILANMDRAKEEGLDLIALPQLPALSDLLRVNPYVKAQKHIDELFKELAEFTYKHSAVVVLLGHLDAKFKPYGNPRTLSMSPNASFTGSQPSNTMSQAGGREPSRLMLTPVTFGKRSSGNRAAGEAGLNEHRITARLVFYNDWYHKSPYIRSKDTIPDDSEDVLVLVVKITSLGGVGNINEPVFFDLSARHPNSNAPLNGWLVDFQVQDEENLSTLIQDSINSTQAPRGTSTQIARQLAIHSSPFSSQRKFPGHGPSEGEKEDRDNEEEEEGTNEEGTNEGGTNEEGAKGQKNEEQGTKEQGAQELGHIENHSVSTTPEANDFPDLYIEGSDVELTGTLLEECSEI